MTVEIIGMTDEELENLSSKPSIFEVGAPFWASWEAENSSFGKTFRKSYFYPKLLPLFFKSDHAVMAESRCYPNEINNKFGLYLTWNKVKFNKMLHYQKTLHVPHPWINYRRRMKIEKETNPQGAIFFWPHSNDITSPILTEKVIFDLNRFEQKYEKLTICLSFHDINKGLHKLLRQYNFPIVTAGNTNSQLFVDRFYSLIYKYKLACSNVIGSSTFYCIEAGIPFILIGEFNKFVIKGSDTFPDGVIGHEDYLTPEDTVNFRNLEKNLRLGNLFISNDLEKLVFDYLGLSSTTNKYKVIFYIWLNFVKSFIPFFYTVIVKK